ncbi:MAG TPA: hypothetical protein VKB55_01385 [Nocardioidaceae bacterium]|nr:hypothetical protein [Nocardioidaceae bacterium]
MSRPTTDIEDRLRQALAARAEQVTPASLRPADPPKVKRRRRFIWVAPILAAAAAVLAILGVMSLVDLHGQESTPPAGQPTIHTSGNCEHEAALMTRALLSPSDFTADVDGDGDGDQVATTTDPNAGPACRAFVGVRTNGELYSTALDPSAVPPPGMRAQLTNAPDLGLDGRADLVVNTHSMVDSALSQIFSWTPDGLVRVQAPGAEGGNITDYGGGMTAPLGAGCTSDGSLVTSTADAVDQGKAYEVTRQIYPVTGGPLEFGDPRMSHDRVLAAQLNQRFPEFAGGGFVPCST